MARRRSPTARLTEHSTHQSFGAGLGIAPRKPTAELHDGGALAPLGQHIPRPVLNAVGKPATQQSSQLEPARHPLLHRELDWSPDRETPHHTPLSRRPGRPPQTCFAEQVCAETPTVPDTIEYS